MLHLFEGGRTIYIILNYFCMGDLLFFQFTYFYSFGMKEIDDQATQAQETFCKFGFKLTCQNFRDVSMAYGKVGLYFLKYILFSF